MKHGIYSIYDTKLQAYLPPFTTANNEVAIREFSQYAQQAQTPIAKHPADYQLIRIGDWDEQTGQPTPTDHVNLDFQTRPALNSVFIEDTPPIKRTIAVQTEPEFLFDAWFDVKAARPMPVYSVPGYIDHF